MLQNKNNTWREPLTSNEPCLNVTLKQP